MASTTVWLARHGEAHNPANLLYGRLPRIRLTPEGLRQAQALADFLACRTLGAVYSSPMLRARRTAEIVLAKHPDLQRVRIDSGLQEVRTGWQGEPIESLERINWDFYGNPRGSDDETIQMIHDRMRRWVNRVLRRHAGSEIVGVSHGDPILILTGSLNGKPLVSEHIFPRPYIATGALYRMDFDAQGACREVQLMSPSLMADAAKDEAAA